MNDLAPGIAGDYKSALRAYLNGAGERSLERAYQLGRRAVELGLGVLDMEAAHREALDDLFDARLPPDASRRVWGMAADFWVESLAPFEMTHRSFQEANTQLRELNGRLQAEIAERQRVEDALREAHDKLERRIEERTSDLARTNAALQAENAQRIRTERDLRESEERFRHISAMTREWIWEQDTEGRFIYSSPGVRSVLGFEPAEILGKYYYELFSPDERECIGPDTIGTVGSFIRIANHYRHKDGHLVITESSGTPILAPDASARVVKWRGIDHDITERKRFEDALRLRDRAIEATRVGILITDARQPGNAIIYANPAFCEMTGYLREELIGQSPRLLQGPDTSPQTLAEIDAALRDHRDCHVTLKNYRKDGTAFWNELVISPVLEPGGQLTHYVGTQTDVTLLRRAEEERHELEIARQIQLSLLPRAPLRIDGVIIAGYCMPAQDVGGDYFDYVSAPGIVDVVIADVSGHSVGAALVMAETRSTLKAEASRNNRRQGRIRRGPADVLGSVNTLLHDDLDRSDLFITMFYLRYCITTQELRYANAGHNCPLLLRHGENRVVELDAEGLILGVHKDVKFEERRATVTTGDLVVLYTDGISEARNASGELFGVERLSDALIASRQRDPSAIIEHVCHELDAFCQNQPFDDDLSLVVMKVMGWSPLPKRHESATVDT